MGGIPDYRKYLINIEVFIQLDTDSKKLVKIISHLHLVLLGGNDVEALLRLQISDA